MQNVWGLGVILRYHFENQHICPLVAPRARAKSLSLQLLTNSVIRFLCSALSRHDLKLTPISSKQFPPLSGYVLRLTLQLHMCRQWGCSHWEVHWHLCASWFARGKSANQRRKQVFFFFQRWNVQTIKSKQKNNGMQRNVHKGMISHFECVCVSPTNKDVSSSAMPEEKFEEAIKSARTSFPCWNGMQISIQTHAGLSI